MKMIGVLNILLRFHF